MFRKFFDRRVIRCDRLAYEDGEAAGGGGGTRSVLSFCNEGRGRPFAFGDLEREKFVRILRAYEEFCGVRVLTFCVMSHHVHVLVHVPKRPDIMPDCKLSLA